jgi:hypothetical protein
MKRLNSKQRGVAMILTMLFLIVFSSLSIGMMTMSNTNAQVATNHQHVNGAMTASISGLECGKYLLTVTEQTNPYSTDRNNITDDDANQMWANLLSTLKTTGIGGATINNDQAFTDAGQTGREMIIGPVNYGNNQVFSLRFYRYDDELTTILMETTGSDGTVSRMVRVPLNIEKEADVMNYAIASRGRMWITQNSEIHGPVYSTWDRPSIGPGIETTSDTSIYGKISTVIPLDSYYDDDGHYIEGMRRDPDNPFDDVHMETLDENDQPMFDGDGNRIYSADDTCQGYHEGIEYDVQHETMPGMEATDYNTSSYKTLCSTIGTEDSITVEYFPHAAEGYNVPKYSSSRKFYRKTYENKTFSNVTIPKGSHCLFKNCTFENVLFVESNDGVYQDTNSQTNNIRFENCDFNGTIATDVPQETYSYSWWMRNTLYFTGEAGFNNQSAFPETTILAPNFNVNLGNTGAMEEGDGNVVTGAVVGGIVDVRGNATIYGTIISTYDTTPYTSGYITNIGAADDGGSESVGYTGGTITIVPPQDKLLPSGIMSPVIMNPDFSGYTEVACATSSVP